MKSKLLKDLCFPDKCGVYGIPAIAEDYDINKTRYLRITDISEDGKLLNDSKKSVTSDDIEKYILEQGDIVFARTGNSTGKSYFHESKNGRLAFAGFLIKFSLNPELVNPKYLRYYAITNHYKQWVENFSLGSTRGNLNAQSFGECPIPLPNRKQQDLLAKVLSDLDAKIEVNNKINQALEAMAKTLYDYWFVQFDFPDPSTSSGKAGKPYKSSGGKMVFNEELKREIPEGWEVGALLDIANFQNGLACQKYRPIDENFLPVIKIKEMRDGFTERTEKVRKDVPDRIKIYDGDVLFSWSASLEVMIWSGGDGALNQHIFKVTSDDYPKSYYYFELLNYLQHFKMIADLRKTTMGHITQDHLKQSRIAIPTMILCEEIEKKIRPILKSVVSNQQQNQKLSELRDWLLPMLMNGQVTVGEAEQELGMVAEERETYK